MFLVSSLGRILGDVNLNLDDKAAIKARGLWEDWHLRQLIDHPSRTNHVSGELTLLNMILRRHRNKGFFPAHIHGVWPSFIIRASCTT